VAQEIQVVEVQQMLSSFPNDPAQIAAMEDQPFTFRLGLLHRAKKLVEDLYNLYRDSALKRAAEKGSPNKSGNPTLVVDGTSMQRQEKVASIPDLEGLKALLSSKDIPLEEGFNVEKVYTFNPSKIQFLIDSGKILKTDVDALRKVTYSMIVKPNPEIAEKLAVGFEQPQTPMLIEKPAEPAPAKEKTSMGKKKAKA
jgi:hypothetical protein